VLPALAGSETIPAVEAVNVGGGIYGEEHHWSPAQVAVAVGGSVSLSNPTEVKHGVYWVGGPSKPSCSAGVPVGTGIAASGVKWSGSCTFATAGVYTFYCTVHGAAMTARVTVGEVATTPTTTGTTTSLATGSTGTSNVSPTGQAGVPPNSSPASSSPFNGSLAKAIRFAPGAHTGTITGSVALSAAAGSGRLKVDLLLRRGSRLTRVGGLVRSKLGAGVASFTLALSASAARLLHSHHRLVVTVKLELTPLNGATVHVTRSVVLHR
jgi:plastocyanin